MSCACGSGKRAGQSNKYKATSVTGEDLGEFLTATEARIAVTAAGGGTVTPVPSPQK